VSEPRRARLPGGADPDAVSAALAALGALGEQVVPSGQVGSLTTYRVGGAAALLVTASSEADLALVAAAQRASQLPVLVVGRGSNLLVADAGFGGIAVVLDPSGFGGVSIDGLRVRAGGAVLLPILARQTAEAGLTGLEWAVGVPGSVGGGVRMNAGGHGSDMAHTLDACRVVDIAVDLEGADGLETAVGLEAAAELERGGPGPSRSMAVADLHYGYRSSAIGSGQVVVEATFELRPGDREQGRATIRDIVRWRREHQPGGQNAGSVFTNPAGEPPANSAGWLIEAAGCKGRRQGSAVVSSKHANFIQADEGGSAADIRALMEAVRTQVWRVHGIELQAEVRLVGFSNPNSQVDSYG
jgi:UDP-N-acetylmuramate dehydrogenase